MEEHDHLILPITEQYTFTGIDVLDVGGAQSLGIDVGGAQSLGQVWQAK